MCEIRLLGGLPFVRAELEYRGHRIALEHVLLDTGSGGSVFSADQLLNVDLHFERGDPVRRIRGVGGTESIGQAPCTHFKEKKPKPLSSC